MKNARRSMTALALVLTMLALPVSSAGAARVASSDVVVVEPTGQGFWEAVACAACIGGAATVVAGGAGAVLVWASSSGSFWVAAACVGACVEAFE